MKFHERLRELRKFNNMTQEELSLKMGISAAAVGLYEQDRRSPDNETLIKLASIFDVSIDYLLGFEDKKTITDAIIANNKTRVLYSGKDELKIEIANLTKQILDNTENTDTLVMLRDMLAGVCKK